MPVPPPAYGPPRQQVTADDQSVFWPAKLKRGDDHGLELTTQRSLVRGAIPGPERLRTSGHRQYARLSAYFPSFGLATAALPPQVQLMAMIDLCMALPTGLRALGFAYDGDLMSCG